MIVCFPIYAYLYWSKFGEEEFHESFYFNMVVWLIVEYSIQMNYKARANLFVESEMNKR